jgi:hypothetical protein
MSRAVPPRPANEYHVTVAYFPTLSSTDAQRLREHWQGKRMTLQVDGWGTAKEQVSYFTPDRLTTATIQRWRSQLTSIVSSPFSATDPHLTFGVSATRPSDVHGVPKPKMADLAPVRLQAEIHLRQGDAGHLIW